jgi:nicotinamidase/pyrazinamidase
MKALLLVDLQNDFLPGGALPVPRGDEVVPVANRVQRAFDLIVATQDWHPADHGSFAARHPGRKPGELAQLGGLPQVLWPTHCVQDSFGAAFAPALDTTRLTRVFTKGTDPAIDSYSGFFDNGHRKATGLGDFLRDRGVTDVYVLGLATDYCVKATALDAVRLGFTTHLILDGCRGVELNAGDVTRAIEEMTVAGVRLTTSEALLAAAPQTAAPPAIKYRKKQVVIEATQWWRPGDHPAVVHPIPVNVPVIENGREVACTATERATLPLGTIQTLEGWMLVHPGDYIIRGVVGEHYACRPDIFLRTYEPLTETAA